MTIKDATDLLHTMMVRDEILAELAGIVIRDYNEKWGK